VNRIGLGVHAFGQSEVCQQPIGQSCLRHRGRAPA
jgi:hypothetical protein